MPPPPAPRPRSRGAAKNVPNRFERLSIEIDQAAEEDAYRNAPDRLATEVLSDDSQSILTRNASPDLSFNLSLNPYRGCEHGCAYCYARPYHEYLGFSSGLDFESKIVVKHDAARLLRNALSHPRYTPEKIAMSGVTDCYQPVEKSLMITRACLEVLAEFRQPVVVITKNRLVARDRDLLGELASHGAGAAILSLTTLEADLQHRLEPRATSPTGRLETISMLADAGVPVGVSVAPVIPGLTDHEIPKILAAAREAGATFATYSIVRLPHGVKDIFSDWLAEHRPGEKDGVLGRILDLRGGTLNDSDFGSRMRGQGIYADQISALFRIAARKAGFGGTRPQLTVKHFRRTLPGQRELFD